MKHRQLGLLTVSAMGLGCMGMSAFYGSADEDEAVRTIQRALGLRKRHRLPLMNARRAIDGRIARSCDRQDRHIEDPQCGGAQVTGSSDEGS